MNALNKRVNENREREIALQAAKLALGAALLAADDLWGLDEATTERFTHAFAEIVNGYSAEGGIKAMQQELEDRKIEVKIGG